MSNPKSGWNYRVVKDEQGYFVTDVYYTNGKPDSWGERHFFLDGETKDDLDFQIGAVSAAWSEPVLFINGDEIKEEAQS